jgi:hypothetical protein
LIKFPFHRIFPVFPLAIASNLFSVTALLIFFGVSGDSALAADIGVIQGASLTIFLAFSGNSRNLILGKSSEISYGQLVRFRVLFIVPFGVLVYLLCQSFPDLPEYLVIALIVRRCTEWIAELIITKKEREEDYSFAERYVFLQSITFSTLLLHDTVSSDIYNLFLSLWAITPILLGGKHLLQYLNIHSEEKLFPGSEYILHLGSSWVIATTTFVSRIMIIALTTKALGGALFTAFAIGGMISSIYTYVIGPSLIHKETGKIKKIFQTIFLFCSGSGIAIALLSETISIKLGTNILFFQALGFSMLGGAIMMVSQRKRIILLQIRQENTFVPDVLTNVLIIAFIPLAFYSVGQIALSAMFFCSACLTYIFYSLPINVDQDI